MRLLALFALLSLWGISNSRRHTLHGKNGDWCEETFDCHEKLHCVNGRCRKSLGQLGWPCDKSSDCSRKERLICLNERCAASRAYGESCKSDQSCGVELLCHKGRCRTPRETRRKARP